MKTHKISIFRFFLMFLILSLLLISFIFIYKKNSSDTHINNKAIITGEVNLYEYTGYNAILSYELNIDEENDEYSLDSNITYNNITLITGCIYTDINGNAHLKIPLLSSKVYTFNLYKYILKIPKYLEYAGIIKIFATSITDIKSGECEVSRPSGTIKELTSEDIDMFYDKIKKKLN